MKFIFNLNAEITYFARFQCVITCKLADKGKKQSTIFDSC